MCLSSRRRSCSHDHSRSSRTKATERLPTLTRSILTVGTVRKFWQLWSTVSSSSPCAFPSSWRRLSASSVHQARTIFYYKESSQSYRYQYTEISNPKLVVIVGSFGLASNFVGLFLFHGAYICLLWAINKLKFLPHGRA